MKKVLFLVIIFNLLFANVPEINLALQANNFDKALWYAKQLFYMSETDSNAEIYYYLGASYAGLDRDVLAEKAFDEFFSRTFSLDQAYKVAEYYREIGKNKKARMAYEKILSKYPEQKIALEEVGKLYFEQKDYGNTIKVLSGIIKDNEMKANPLAYYVGISYDELKKYDNAEKYLKMALSNGFNEPELHYTLGKISINKGFYREGLDSLLLGMKTTFNPVPAQVYFNLGVAYSKLGEYKLAEDASKKAIESGYEYVGGYINYANSAIRNGRYQAVIDVLEPNVDKYRNNSKYLNALAISYENTGLYDNAIAYYQMVLNLDPSQEETIRVKLDALRNAAAEQ